MLLYAIQFQPFEAVIVRFEASGTLPITFMAAGVERWSLYISRLFMVITVPFQPEPVGSMNPVWLFATVMLPVSGASTVGIDMSSGAT